ncbi:hypothetical protein VP1G_00670 [Cytospora mali]|uniref:Uncharacterized protein n=1 Tax=Cytospora mali TaxID=578113 RepID=A0A194UNZ1_CYTMA|nr:hypothetical protein VP1G_00670 [Valsa mali var. pyri (nom. inval.)]
MASFYMFEPLDAVYDVGNMAQPKLLYPSLAPSFCHPTCMAECQGQGAIPQPSGIPQVGMPLMGMPWAGILRHASPHYAHPQYATPQLTIPQYANVEATVPQAVIPQTVYPQATSQQYASPQRTVPQAANPLASVRQNLEVARRKRGRPRAHRAHDPRPSPDEPELVRVAWATAEGAFTRLEKAKQRLAEAQKAKKAREILAKERCVEKNASIYHSAVADYNETRTSAAHGRPANLPATEAAEEVLDSLEKKLAARLQKFNVSSGLEADILEGVGKLNRAETLWVNKTKKDIRHQMIVVQACKERDIIGAA